MKPLGLYLHIPYCPYRCHYCDFLILTNQHETIPRYVEALIQDLENFSKDYPDHEIQSVFIGGGTPSLLPPDSIHKVLHTVKTHFAVKPNPEITLESNPDTLTLENLTGFLNAKINRLSLGIQSLHDDHLRRMGRGHSAKQAFQAFQTARQAGFKNLSVDLIFGLPEQTLTDWRETLQKCLAWEPEHFSAYGLQLEKGTRFWLDYKMSESNGQLASRSRANEEQAISLKSLDFKKGQLSLPDTNLQADMYEALLDIARKKGYEQYEISNFSKPGFQSKHNLIYWKNEEYLGLGLGAVSYINKKRFWMTRNLANYLSGKERVMGSEVLSRREQMAETLMLGLRLKEGISVKEFAVRFQENLEELYKDEISRFESLHLLTRQKDRLAFTRKGMLLSNEVLQAFF